MQHCPPGRFLLFATIGLAIYLMGPAPLRRAWQRLLAMMPPMHVCHPRVLISLACVVHFNFQGSKDKPVAQL
jgi:hypothetical protein